MALAVALALFQQFSAPVSPPQPKVEPVAKPPSAQPEKKPEAKPPVQEPKQEPKFYVDEKVGSGEAVAKGDIGIIHMEAFDAAGKELVSTKKRGLAFRFELGTEEPVLTGLVEGMRPGGIRKALLPKEQLRDGKGLPPLIPADSAVQIRIWLLTKEKPKPPR